MGSIDTSKQDKIVLYTAHICPWAHRADIALRELGLEFEKVHIDLTTARPQWYLDINPRGLVPTIRHTDPELPSLPDHDPNTVTVIESSLVVQYLVDAFPKLSQHLTAYSAYEKYQQGLLVDVWVNKIGAEWMKTMVSMGTDQVGSDTDKLVELIKSTFEPVLAQALGKGGRGPYCHGSDRFTLAEILLAPFIFRVRQFSNDKVHLKSLQTRLDEFPAFGPWSKAISNSNSVNYYWENEEMSQYMVDRTPQMRAKYGKH